MFRSHADDLFIEVLKEVFTLYGKNQNVPQFPGIYLLLVHPDDQVGIFAILYFQLAEEQLTILIH